MKKLLVNLAICAVLATVLSACDSSNKQASTDPAVAAPAEPAQAPNPGLAVAYADDVLTIPVGGYCSLDTVNGTAVSNGRIEWKHGVPAVFIGWATEQSGVVPAHPELVIHNKDGRYAIPLSTGVARPDVAAALKSPSLGNAGYESPADLRNVPAGIYDLSIVTSGDNRNRCPLNVLLTLAD